jgi:hypothetical protein
LHTYSGVNVAHPTNEHFTSKNTVSGLFCSYSAPDFCEAASVPNSLIKRLRGRIAEARHDIEAIEIHIASKDGASTSPEHIEGLRGLQEMYRKRIAQIDAEIPAPPSAKDGNS